MSILSGKLTTSAGLGNVGSAGAYSSAAYGGNSTMYPASSTGSGNMNLVGTAQTGIGNIFEGKLTLAAIEVIVAGLVVFYVWTHKIQGGG